MIKFSKCLLKLAVKTIIKTKLKDQDQEKVQSNPEMDVRNHEELLGIKLDCIQVEDVCLNMLC